MRRSIKSERVTLVIREVTNDQPSDRHPQATNKMLHIIRMPTGTRTWRHMGSGTSVSVCCDQSWPEGCCHLLSLAIGGLCCPVGLRRCLLRAGQPLI